MNFQRHDRPLPRLRGKAGMRAGRSPYFHASLSPTPALQHEAGEGARQRPRQTANSRHQRGYTLIEVVVAFALLALGMTLLLGTLSGAARQVRWSADAGRATLHAQSLLDQTGVGEAIQPGRRDGEFENGRYRWSLEVVPYVDAAQATQVGVDPTAPQLMRLVLSVQWRDGGPRERLQLQSLRLVAPDATQGVSL
jgi:general secretion pathway protein I